jgi:hypothetical protein
MIFVLLLAVTATHAQVSLSVKGGWNNANADVKNSLYNSRYVSHAGWQAGLRAEYTLKNWVLYTGLGVDKFHLFNSRSDDKKAGIDYKAVYLTLPAGLGYDAALSKNLHLRLYGGVYLSQGVGGWFHSARVMSAGWMCDPGACPEIVDVVDRKIHFGNKGEGTKGDDLVATNWGAQFGVGLAAWHKWELLWMYNMGFNNLMPDGIGDGTHHLRSVSLDLKYSLPVTRVAVKK